MQAVTVGGPGKTDLMLSVKDHMTLELAGARFKHPGARATAIRTQLGYSEARFAQVVGSLIDRPDALEAYPALVRRLQRVRDQRRSERARAS